MNDSYEKSLRSPYLDRVQPTETELIGLQERLTRLHQQFLTYIVIREIESPQPVILPSGRRLRGVSFPGGVYLARDRHFYDERGNRLTYGGVLARVSFDDLLQALRSAVTARLALRKARGQALQNLVNILSR